MKNLDVEVILLPHYPDKEVPSYVTEGSAGLDLKAAIQYVVAIEPLTAQLIPTGLRLHIKSEDVAFVLVPKSGLGHKKGIILGNTLGVIDSDYQGEIFVSVWNRNPLEIIFIEPNSFICQGLFMPVIKPTLKIVSEFSTTTSRGEKGFGQATKISHG